MEIPLRSYLRVLQTYLAHQSVQLGWLAFLLVAAVGLQLLNPQIVRRFIDAARDGSPAQDLLRFALLFMAIALCQQICAVCATYVGEKIAWQATNHVRADLALHCLYLDMSFHHERTPGELIERIDGDVDTLANFFSQFVIQLMGNLLLLVGILSVLFTEDWRLGLTFTLFAVASLTLFYRIRHVAVPYWGDAREASAQLFGFIEERLQATEDICANGAGNYGIGRLCELMGQQLHKDRRAGLYGLTLWMASRAMLLLGNICAFLLSAYLFWTGSFSLGTVYLIFHYTELLRYPLDQMVRQISDLQRAAAGILRVQELMDTKRSLSDGPGAALPDGPLAVTFQNVTFRYREQQTILRNLNFRLEPGRVLGLLGRTGSGKTTVTRLLFRLYDPMEGTITLGDTDIRSLKLAELRRHVGLVTQSVELFQASVRDNLTFFDSTVSDEKIMRALADVGLREWIETLPNGLATQLDAAGGGLSAGQAQLLAMARLFLQDPGLVILDEASSRLDPATEAHLATALDRLLVGRTAIMIAHRPATLQRADEIMILKDGQIVEYGPRHVLAANANSRFSQRVRTEFQEVLA